MAARVIGCTTIIAADVHDSRLELASELGATDVVRTQDGPLAEALLAATGGRGVNYILDTTAVPGILTAAAHALSIRGMLALEPVRSIMCR
jgi:aryl-alcohol dehydrogenase